VGQAQKFLDWDYKIKHASDHVAKFHSDQPTELGNLVLKKKKELQ